MVGRLGTRVGAGLLVLIVAGCASHPRILTGLGATKAVWNAHHDAAYSSVLTDAAGHVQGYVLTMSARPLDRAIVLVKKDLPADATVSAPQLTVGIEATKCEIVEFTSPTLARTLGGVHGGDVMAAFQAENAIVMDTTRIARAVVVSGNEGLPRQC